MKCPNCFVDNNKVLNCRMYPNHNSFYRRRECLSCGHRFSTWETYCPDEYDTIDRRRYWEIERRKE